MPSEVMALAVATTICSPPAIDSDQPGPAHAQKHIRTAIVLRKTTRWDWEKEKHPRKTEEELTTMLRERGENVQKMRDADRRQKDVVREIVARLEKNGVVSRSVSRTELSSWVGWADLVVAAGGDGTFLTAAAAAQDDTPTIGINSDPVGSEGHLCIGGKNPPHDLIERIVTGKFKWAERCRIRVTLLNRKHEAKNKCILALNEVFVGEQESARVSTYDISLDDKPYVKQKSSGLIVSTGSGSTSWYYGVNRFERFQVERFVRSLIAMGSLETEDFEETVNRTLKDLNDKIPFEADHPNFAYAIREPIFNETYPEMAASAFSSRIRLRSRCAQGFLVLDGSTKIPFNAGAEVLLEMLPSDSLRTIKL